MRRWKKPWGQAVIFGPILFVMTVWAISLHVPLLRAPDEVRRDFQQLIGKGKSEVMELKGVPLQVWKSGSRDFPSDNLGKPKIQRAFHDVWLLQGRSLYYVYVYFDKSGTCFAIDVVGS